jgi:hypothetical protein
VTKSRDARYIQLLMVFQWSRYLRSDWWELWQVLWKQLDFETWYTKFSRDIQTFQVWMNIVRMSQWPLVMFHVLRKINVQKDFIRWSWVSSLLRCDSGGAASAAGVGVSYLGRPEQATYVGVTAWPRRFGVDLLASSPNIFQTEFYNVVSWNSVLLNCTGTGSSRK